MGKEKKENQSLNQLAMEQARLHWNNIAKPLYGLGRLEDIFIRMAGICETPDLRIEKRAVLVLCADNGIVEEGVSQSGQEVTLAVTRHIANGTSSVAKMAKTADVDVIPVDIGVAADTETLSLEHKKVAWGTRNFIKEPAMTREETRQAIEVGIHLVAQCKEQGYHILALGEMGIGNTTTSTALLCGLLKVTPQEITDRGAGLSADGLSRKREVIQIALKQYEKDVEDPFVFLCDVGGLDIAGLVGVCLGAAKYRIPVILDGVISAAAAICAVQMHPEVQSFLFASHMGREAGMKYALDALGLEPIIHGNLALGEGTGAVCLVPLLDMAMEVYRSNTTFSDMKIRPYKEFET